MAEKKDPITLYAEAKGITRAQAIADLEGINKGFTSLYETGDFSLISEDESSAHKGLAATFKSDPLLLRAFDTFRKSQGDEGVQETLASANDTWNISDFVRKTGDAVTGGDTQESFERALYEPYGFTKSATGGWTPPYQQKQAAEADAAVFNSVAPTTDKEVDEIKKTLAPAPAPGQAQAARPTLDQPDNGKAAFARAAANAEPDFINRLNGNARWANPVKAQLEQEAKRRLQNEIAELKKSEKATKRAGEVDEILNTLNDQYRQLYANTPDAEGNARSAEDWDAMDRDQKIKLVQNYNKNRLLAEPEDDKEKKSLEKPAGEITGQKMNALESPRGSLEDIVYWDESKKVPVVPETPARNEAGGPKIEAPAPSLNEMRTDQMREFARTPAISPEVKTRATQGFDQISAPNGVPMTELETLNVSPMDDAAKQSALPQALQNRGIREGEAPYDPARGLTNLQNPAPAPKQPSILNTPAPSIAQSDNEMSTALPMDSVNLMNQVDAYEKANPPTPPSTAVSPIVSPESFERQVRTPERPEIDMDGIQSQVSTDSRAQMQNNEGIRNLLSKLPPPSELLEEGRRDSRYQLPAYSQQESIKSEPIAPAQPKEEGFLSKLKNFDLFDYVEDLQSRNNKPISPDELAKKRQAPPSMMDKLEPFRSKMLKKFDDKMGPIYEGDPAALDKISRAIPDVFDMDNYEQAPKVIRAKNNTPQAPAPQAPAPAQSPKLPSVDPFKEDGPAEIPEPRGTVKVRNSDGSFTYTTREEQKRRAEEYAKRQMRNSPRSLLGDTHSEDMRKLYPSLNMDKLTRDVDTTNYNQQRKQFDEKYASRMYPQTAANPTPRTDTMMRNINAMPQRQQLDVINSFRKHRGEDEIHNPFA